MIAFFGCALLAVLHFILSIMEDDKVKSDGHYTRWSIYSAAILIILATKF